MSQYLCIRKGNQDLVSFSRNSDIYQAFALPYAEEWTELTFEDYNKAINNLQLTIEDYKENIELHEKALEGLSYEEKLDCLKNIKDFKEELRNTILSKHWVELLMMIAEEDNIDGGRENTYYCIS